MTNFDIDNGEELQPYKDYNYDLIDKEYSIDENNASSTYNQFIQLRDTLVYSGKKYNGKAGCKLCIGEKEETVEIVWNNIFKQDFENITDWARTDTALGPYVKRDYTTASNVPYSPISCVVQKDGWYHLKYKIEVLPKPTEKKVYTYFDIYRIHEPVTDPVTYDLLVDGGTAVFDMQGEGTLSGTTSGTEPNGSCSVSFKLGQLLQKVTAMGDMEMNLKKGDIVVLRAKDAERGTNPAPLGNDLTFQSNSNYWSIEYIGVPVLSN